MALQDYWHDCWVVERRIIADGLGGYETVESIGVQFRGLATKKSSQEQLIGAVRGNINAQYNFSTVENMPIDKDSTIMFIDRLTRKKTYLRLTSDGVTAPDTSSQRAWKVFDAESYVPVKVV
nr:MAG TPA: head closure knob [Caudoviricetes sp.]